MLKIATGSLDSLEVASLITSPAQVIPLRVVIVLFLLGSVCAELADSADGVFALKSPGLPG